MLERFIFMSLEHKLLPVSFSESALKNRQQKRVPSINAHYNQMFRQPERGDL